MKKREIIILFGSTFILVVSWIIFNVYHNTVTSTISEKLNIEIKYILPDFDTQTVEKIKQRKKVTPIYEIEETLSKPLGKEKNPTENSIATGSALESSQGASLQNEE